MKICNILCVCGSGTVSSAMVAGKLKEKLKEKGWDASMVEASPNSTGGRLHHELRYHVPSADCGPVLCILV